MEVREGLDANERPRREVLRGDEDEVVRLRSATNSTDVPNVSQAWSELTKTMTVSVMVLTLVPCCSVVVHALVTTSIDAVVVSCEHVWTRTSNVALGCRRKNVPLMSVSSS